MCLSAMALQCSLRNYGIKKLMVRDLPLRPASLFDDCGAKMKTKTKLFKGNLKVELAPIHASVDASSLDGRDVLRS